MKIAILGTGAMGSVYAALFSEAGHEVWAVDAWPEHVAAIRERGLRLEGASGDRVVKGLHAAVDVAEAGPCDLYVIATKAAAVAAAARAVAPLLGPDSLVLTIQNGLGAAERAAAELPPGRLLIGVAEGFGASLRGPGHAHHNAMKLIRVGEPGGGLTPRLESLAALWREAGFEVRAFEDIETLVWEKFVCNVAYSAPCAVFRCTIGEVQADPERWRVAAGAAREAHAVGRAKGVAFGFDDAEAYVRAFGARMPAARPSLLLDHLAGRRSEIDAINGMVPVLGAETGIATPYNDVLTAVVHAREAEFPPPPG
jgi:2-dehydropantoate 2-reductase